MYAWIIACAGIQIIWTMINCFLRGFNGLIIFELGRLYKIIISKGEYPYKFLQFIKVVVMLISIMIIIVPFIIILYLVEKSNLLECVKWIIMIAESIISAIEFEMVYIYGNQC
ncbi:hypothetical protein FMM68_12700 [Lachnospiraceae bacterium MD329]|nr:hypothetical protein [Lachnospiraceae bacterium MD329]